MSSKSILLFTFGAHFLSVQQVSPLLAYSDNQAVWLEPEKYFFRKNIAVCFDGCKKLYNLAPNYNPFYN